jgi:indole-3-glycerol phosphate synthase
VAESGIRGQEDILQLRSDGAGAFLIGESLIRSGNPGDQLANLLKKG